MKPKLMTAHYPGRCQRCKTRFPAGAPIYWSKATKAICTKCGEQGSPDDGIDKAKREIPSPPPPKPEPPKPVAPPIPKPGTTHDFTIDWSELKEMTKQAFNGKFPKLRSRNLATFRENLLNPREWHGFTAGQVQRWITEGYQTQGIHGLSEFTPMIREKRRLRYVEEGSEFHADLAMSGDENFMSEWTKREVIPGVSLDCIVTFAASTPAEVVNAYNTWICRTVYSLESAGVDCEVTLNFQVNDTLDGLNGLTNTRVRVKKENEVSDFLSISPMLSPAAFRGFLFAATALHAEAKKTDASYGLGNGPNEMPFSVSYDAEARKIVVTSQRIGATVFPEERMTNEFREALKAAMRG